MKIVKSFLFGGLASQGQDFNTKDISRGSYKMLQYQDIYIYQNNGQEGNCFILKYKMNILAQTMVTLKIVCDMTNIVRCLTESDDEFIVFVQATNNKRAKRILIRGHFVLLT